MPSERSLQRTRTAPVACSKLDRSNMQEASAVLSFFYFLLPLVLLFSFRLLFPRRQHGPLCLPIVGHLHLLRSAPLHHSLARICARHGPDLFLRFGSRPVLVVSSPDAVAECYTTHDLAFTNRPYNMASELISYNATTFGVAPYGAAWRSLRHAATVHLLSSTRQAKLEHVRTASVRSLLRSLPSSASSEQSDGEFLRVSMRSRFATLALDSLLEMIVGEKPGSGRAEEGEMFAFMLEEVLRLSALGSLEEFLPLLKWVGVSGLRKQFASLDKEMDALLQEMVDKRRRRKCLVSDKKTLVDAMLSMQEEDPLFYTDDIIKGMISVLMVAGFDTSTITMEWALSLLLNHPKAMEKAHEEISAEVGEQRLVTAADLPKLRYLNYVIKEALRLFPPGPTLVPRESTADCKVAGLDVPRGTMLLINAYAVHRNPKIWEDPAEFRPERFESADGDQLRYTFIPFGGGRRRCPGEAMAFRSIAMVLAALIQCFEWKRVGEEMVDMTEGEGLSMPKAVPLEALCKPRPTMLHLLSQL